MSSNGTLFGPRVTELERLQTKAKVQMQASFESMPHYSQDDETLSPMIDEHEPPQFRPGPSDRTGSARSQESLSKYESSGLRLQEPAFHAVPQFRSELEIFQTTKTFTDLQKKQRKLIYQWWYLPCTIIMALWSILLVLNFFLQKSSTVEIFLVIVFFFNAITYYDLQKRDDYLFQGLLAIQVFMTVACLPALLVMDGNEVDLDKKEEEYAIFVIGIVPAVPFLLTNAGFMSALADKFAIKVFLNAGTLALCIGFILVRTGWVLLLSSGIKFGLLQNTIIFSLAVMGSFKLGGELGAEDAKLMAKQSALIETLQEALEQDQEGVMIFDNGLESYQNSKAFALLQPTSDHDIPLFYSFDDDALDESEFTLEHLLAGRGISDKTFTQHRDLALSRDRVVLLSSMKPESFDFFRIRKFPLGGGKVLLRFVDVTEEIQDRHLSQAPKFVQEITENVKQDLTAPLQALRTEISLGVKCLEEMEEQLKRSGISQRKLGKVFSIQERAKAHAKILEFNYDGLACLPALKFGSLQKICEHHSLEETIDQVKQIVASTSKLKSLNLTSSAPDVGQISFDKQRVQQVLMSFLANSVKFTDHEAGRIRIFVQVADSEREMKSFKDELNCFFGMGMPQYLLCLSTSSVQDHFFVRDSPKLIMTVLDNGVGFESKPNFPNLRLVGLLAKHFGGTVLTLSSPEVGSVFSASFELPDQFMMVKEFERIFADGLADPKKILKLSLDRQVEFADYFILRQESKLHQAVTRLSQVDDQGTKRILIVDDNPDSCTALLTMLQVMGLQQADHRVDLCMSGKDAMMSMLKGIHPEGYPPLYDREPQLIVQSHARAERFIQFVREAAAKDIFLDPSALGLQQQGPDHECVYSLILVDCEMPVMDGYETSLCLRMLLEAGGICSFEAQPKIIAMTENYSTESQLRAAGSGMEKVFPKPMKEETLGKLLMESGFHYNNSIIP